MLLDDRLCFELLLEIRMLVAETRFLAAKLPERLTGTDPMIPSQRLSMLRRPLGNSSHKIVLSRVSVAVVFYRQHNLRIVDLGKRTLNGTNTQILVRRRALRARLLRLRYLRRWCPE